MRLVSLSIVVSALVNLMSALGGIWVHNAYAADEIAISVPLSGDASELGRKFRTGAKLAAEMLAIDRGLFIVDDGCDKDLAALAAQDLLDRKPAIVIGLLCNDPAKVVAGSLSGTQIPAIVAGARSVRLIKDREREDWNLWRMSPGDDYAVQIAAEGIARLWRETPYAIVDDGTIYGRSFTDLLRGRMQELGLPPQVSDSFRAAQSTQAGLLRRLQRSGVSAAFIASATTEDLVTIASNLSEFDVELDLMTTDALAVLPFLEEAKDIPPGLRIVAERLPEAPELEALLAEREIFPELQIYQGFAAMQIAASALSDDPSQTSSNLRTTTFQTVLGEVRFSQDGSSSYNPYKLLQWDGEVFAPDPESAGAQAN